MVHHRKYPLFTFDLVLRVKITQNHASYASAKLEVATLNGLREDAFTRKDII